MPASETQSLQQISVDELKPGMYVVALYETPETKIKINSEGYIKTEQIIEQLQSSGVHFVSVDPSKEKPVDSIDKVLGQEHDDIVSDNLATEIKKAKNIIDDAKKIQQEFINSFKSADKVNLQTAEKITLSIIASVFRNQDALLCYSNLRDKNSYLMEHSIKTSILMTLFARFLKFDDKTVRQLSLGAFLHDTGKALIAEEIINKPGKLTEQEYGKVKNHINLALKRLTKINALNEITIKVIKEQSECLDGSGYPNGLKGDEISVYGRMMNIIDRYDAMTSERVYKSSIAPIKAFKKLMAETPDKLDQELVEQFIQCLGVYPIGTLVKLESGKVGLVTKLNNKKPLNPFVQVFYNVRLNQTIPIKEIDLSQPKFNDQIDSCVKPEEFNLNLLGFFKEAFLS